MENFHQIFEKQKANRWKVSRTTADERIVKLKKIREAIFARREELHQAIFEDFQKNPGETDLTEVFPVIAEINDAIKNLSRWMKPKKVKTPIVLFGTHSEIRLEAKGVVLILSPWNYPFQLLMSPVVAAMAAGNCVIAKPSSKVPHTSHFLKSFFEDLFVEDEVVLLEGGSDVADQLLAFPFDHIFFTGSTTIGKKVMEAASSNLAPVTLELGGKSPVIVDATANIQKTAERIMWGKYINAGQTCVAPDYLLIHESVKDAFVDEARKVVEKRYGSNGTQESSPDFCRLVSTGHLQGLKKVLESSITQGAKIEMGGNFNGDGRYFSPTLLSNVTNESPIMKEEIFGPILPILTFKNIEEAIQIIRKREKPLALYIFSNNKETVEHVLQNTTAGGTCVNSLIVHLANSHLPFGGVGASGMGNYHGYFGFKTFSHERAVLTQGAIDTLRFFYPPYTPMVKRLIHWAIKYFA